MRYKDRTGKEVCANGQQDVFLQKMYGTALGRKLLSVLVQPVVSKIAGRFMDSGLSAVLVSPFVQKNHIDLSQYEKKEFTSYNDFFTRKIRPSSRPFAEAAEAFTAPCDSKLSVYPITEEAQFCIKDTQYTMESLTRSKRVAKEYEGGILCVFRLTVDDYHRYAFVDDGELSREFHIPGVYHTVNPVAGEYYPIYKENTGEYALLKTVNFGTVLMMEVGALMVGRIENVPLRGRVKRGKEKGNFAFGGSTIVLMTQKDRVLPDPDIFFNSEKGIETRVHLGEKIGVSEVKNDDGLLFTGNDDGESISENL